MGLSRATASSVLLLTACIEVDAPRPAPATAPARPAAEGSFEVRVEPPTTAARNQPTAGRVSVVAHAPWHLNLDFPAKLRLRGSEGVRLTAPAQQKADAARYDEDALVFDVPLTVHRCGEQQIDGEIDFAVCDDGSCAPSSEHVAMSVAAC
jgi:hypothetical protein